MELNVCWTRTETSIYTFYLKKIKLNKLVEYRKGILNYLLKKETLLLSTKLFNVGLGRFLSGEKACLTSVRTGIHIPRNHVESQALESMISELGKGKQGCLGQAG